MGYTSEDTTVLATSEQAGGNTMMLLVHEVEGAPCGYEHEYVIGSYLKVYKEYMESWEDSSGKRHVLIADRHGTVVTEDTYEEVGMANGRWTKMFDADGSVYYYSWVWGHYFHDFDEAARYWLEEVRGMRVSEIETS